MCISVCYRSMQTSYMCVVYVYLCVTLYVCVPVGTCCCLPIPHRVMGSLILRGGGNPEALDDIPSPPLGLSFLSYIKEGLELHDFEGNLQILLSLISSLSIWFKDFIQRRTK